MENVASTASSASSSFQERLGDTHVLQMARENSASALGSARGALSIAGERVSGVAAITMDPRRLWRFLVTFAAGSLLILISLNFLPMLVIAPATFSLLFTCGSITMLSSFVLLNGPQAFLQQVSQRRKLPFSVAYLVGLLGTLW
ncbi:unnamed protein product, partial [Polarella glacialis]